MIYLQSKSIHSKILELDELTERFRIICKDIIGCDIKINGVYDFIGNNIALLYYSSGQLVFNISNNAIPLDNDVEVSVTGKPSKRIIKVVKEGKVLISEEYSVDTHLKFKDDTTSFVESEDFDFGLFVSTIASDPSRKRVLLNNWSNA